jgi:O-antigen ligase
MLPILVLASFFEPHVRAHFKGLLKRGLLWGLVWIPFGTWLFASSLWALDGSAALLLALRLSLLGLCGLWLMVTVRYLPTDVLAKWAVALTWGLSVVALLVSLDIVSGCTLVQLVQSRPTGAPLADAYSRGSVFHALILVPLSVGLWRMGRPRLAVLQAVLGCAAILLGVQLAAKMALLCGLAAMVVTLRFPVLRWSIPVLLAVAILGAPFALPLQLTPSAQCWLGEHKPSALHRILIWNWVDQHIEERPMLGWGLDASRRMPGGHTHVQIRGCAAYPSSVVLLDNEVLPLHPHNAALQIWLELGGVGAVIATVSVVMTLTTLFRVVSLRGSACLSATVLSALAGALVSFGIWQEWWIALLLTAGAISLMAARLYVSETMISEDRIPS